MTFKTLTLAAAALALVTASAPASAFEASSVHRQMAVGYADLDTSKAPGATVLIKRIKGAARSVCGPQPDLRDLKSQQLFHVCLDESVGHAVAAINNPLVTKIYEHGQSSMSIALRN